MNCAFEFFVKKWWTYIQYGIFDLVKRVSTSSITMNKKMCWLWWVKVSSLEGINIDGLCYTVMTHATLVTLHIDIYQMLWNVQELRQKITYYTICISYDYILQSLQWHALNLTKNVLQPSLHKHTLLISYLKSFSNLSNYNFCLVVIFFHGAIPPGCTRPAYAGMVRITGHCGLKQL